MLFLVALTFYGVPNHLDHRFAAGDWLPIYQNSQINMMAKTNFESYSITMFGIYRKSGLHTILKTSGHSPCSMICFSERLSQETLESESFLYHVL